MVELFFTCLKKEKQMGVYLCTCIFFLIDSNIVGGSVRGSGLNPKADHVHIQHMHWNPFINQQKKGGVGWLVILNLHFRLPDLTPHLEIMAFTSVIKGLHTDSLYGKV